MLLSNFICIWRNQNTGKQFVTIENVNIYVCDPKTVLLSSLELGGKGKLKNNANAPNEHMKHQINQINVNWSLLINLIS